MKLGLHFSKSAIALFIVTAALVSCKKERNEPATEKKDLSAQARAGSILIPNRSRDNNSINVKLSSNYFQNPYNGLYSLAEVYVTCHLYRRDGSERISYISISKTAIGDYCQYANASYVKNDHDTYANVGYIAFISTSPPKQFLEADYSSTTNTYGGVYSYNKRNGLSVGPKIYIPGKVEKGVVAFHLGDDNRTIQFRKGY